MHTHQTYPRGVPPLKDARGTAITRGAAVAANVSGDVAIGTVVGITRGGATKVALRHKAAGHWPGHISTIKRPTSLIVLLPGDVPIEVD